MRPLWSGSLNFGLVNIPIKLFNCISAQAHLDFKMLHKKDFGPIKYIRVCSKGGKEVPYQDIVKGYEYKRGDFVVLTKKDFKKADIKKTTSMSVIEFVNEDEIDPIYFEKPYFILPDSGSEIPYLLLKDALAKVKKVAVVQFVLKNREHLAIIKPYGGGLILDQLRYSSEIKDFKDFKPPAKKVNKNELKVAISLINKLTKHFKPKEFKDTYDKALMSMIKKKIKGKKIIEVPEENLTPTKRKNIMEALKESLKSSSQRKTSRKKTSKKKAKKRTSSKKEVVKKRTKKHKSIKKKKKK